MPSRSTSPAVELASTVVDPEIIFRELEEKMKTLADQILGQSSVSSAATNKTSPIASKTLIQASPFTPVSTLTTQIALLEGDLGRRALTAEPFSAKLPALPPPSI